jgi:hypothetical protein
VGFYAELDPNSSFAQGRIRDAISTDPQPDEAGLIAYLDQGHPLVDFTETTRDVVTGNEAIVGGSSLKSDNTWVWRNDLSFYVRKYHLKLPEAFLDHVRALDFTMPEKNREQIIERAREYFARSRGLTRQLYFVVLKLRLARRNQRPVFSSGVRGRQVPASIATVSVWSSAPLAGDFGRVSESPRTHRSCAALRFRVEQCSHTGQEAVVVEPGSLAASAAKSLAQQLARKTGMNRLRRRLRLGRDAPEVRAALVAIVRDGVSEAANALFSEPEEREHFTQLLFERDQEAWPLVNGSFPGDLVAEVRVWVAWTLSPPDEDGLVPAIDVDHLYIEPICAAIMKHLQHWALRSGGSPVTPIWQAFLSESDPPPNRVDTQVEANAGIPIAVHAFASSLDLHIADTEYDFGPDDFSIGDGEIGVGTRTVGMSVECLADGAVIISGMRAVILERRGPLPTEFARQRLAVMDVRPLLIDLDSPNPVARPAAQSPGFPFKVTSDDPEYFHITARTERDFVIWKLAVDWIYKGRNGTLVVGHKGRPFKVTPDTPLPLST